MFLRKTWQFSSFVSQFQEEKNKKKVKNYMRKYVES